MQYPLTRFEFFINRKTSLPWKVPVDCYQWRSLALPCDIWASNWQKIVKKVKKNSTFFKSYLISCTFFYAILLTILKVIYSPSFSSFGLILWFLKAFVFMTIFAYLSKSLKYDRVKKFFFNSHLWNRTLEKVKKI